MKLLVATYTNDTKNRTADNAPVDFDNESVVEEKRGRYVPASALSGDGFPKTMTVKNQPKEVESQDKNRINRALFKNVPSKQQPRRTIASKNIRKLCCFLPQNMDDEIESNQNYGLKSKSYHASSTGGRKIVEQKQYSTRSLDCFDNATYRTESVTTFGGEDDSDNQSDKNQTSSDLSIKEDIIVIPYHWNERASKPNNNNKSFRTKKSKKVDLVEKILGSNLLEDDDNASSEEEDDWAFFFDSIPWGGGRNDPSSSNYCNSNAAIQRRRQRYLENQQEVDEVQEESKHENDANNSASEKDETTRSSNRSSVQFDTKIHAKHKWIQTYQKIQEKRRLQRTNGCLIEQYRDSMEQRLRTLFPYEDDISDLIGNNHLHPSMFVSSSAASLSTHSLSITDYTYDDSTNVSFHSTSITDNEWRKHDLDRYNFHSVGDLFSGTNPLYHTGTSTNSMISFDSNDYFSFAGDDDEQSNPENGPNQKIEDKKFNAERTSLKEETDEFFPISNSENSTNLNADDTATNMAVNSEKILAQDDFKNGDEEIVTNTIAPNSPSSFLILPASPTCTVSSRKSDKRKDIENENSVVSVEEVTSVVVNNDDDSSTSSSSSSIPRTSTSSSSQGRSLTFPGNDYEMEDDNCSCGWKNIVPDSNDAADKENTTATDNEVKIVQASVISPDSPPRAVLSLLPQEIVQTLESESQPSMDQSRCDSQKVLTTTKENNEYNIITYDNDAMEVVQTSNETTINQSIFSPLTMSRDENQSMVENGPRIVTPPRECKVDEIPSISSTLQQLDNTLTEVCPGIFSTLRGSDRNLLQNDYRNGNVIVSTCFVCRTELMCISDVDYVLCNSCKVITPIHTSANDEIHTPVGKGVGIGFPVKECFQETKNILVI